MDIEGYRPRHPEEPDEPRACFNCVLWLLEVGTSEDAGACRRFPPTVISQGVSLQPKTDGSAYCGEWRQRGGELS